MCVVLLLSCSSSSRCLQFLFFSFFVLASKKNNKSFAQSAFYIHDNSDGFLNLSGKLFLVSDVRHTKKTLFGAVTEISQKNMLAVLSEEKKLLQRSFCVKSFKGLKLQFREKKKYF